MSEATKPLIFLEPLSDTLKKLKEVVEENAESEGIEVFEIEDLEEAAQIIPTIGQCLILVSNPKKCAMMLQGNRKVMRQVQSKTILLSPKQIPRKTLDKFMKVGLTECVVEPVNPKTLLYKVRLQLRSIAKRQEEEKEMKSKFGHEEIEDNANSSTTFKSKKETVSSEEEIHEQNENNKKAQEENTLEDYRNSKKQSNYQEENISGFYKNKTKKNQEEENPTEDKKSRYKEESIDAHYKGNLDQHNSPLPKNKDKKKKSSWDLEEDIDQIKKQLNDEALEEVAKKEKKKELEFADEAQKKAQKKPLLLEEDHNPSTTHQREKEADQGGHYTGAITQGLAIEEESPEFREKKDESTEELYQREKNKRLNIEEDDQDKDLLDRKEDGPIDGHLRGKSQKKLDIKEEREEPLTKEGPLDSDNRNDNQNYKLDIEDELSPKRQKPLQEEDKPAEEKEKREGRPDKMDGHLRGEGIKKSLEVENDGPSPETSKDEEDEDREHSKGTQKALSIEDDPDSLSPPPSSEEENHTGEKTAKLDLINDEDNSSSNQSSHSAPQEEDNHRRKKATLEVDDEGFGKREGLGHREEEKHGHNRSNARADQIKTHYSSKESVRHDENDWGDGWDKKGRPTEDFPSQKREERELIIESEDLGEQTIDYGQLKKEFAGITIDGIPNKKPNYGISENIAEIKTYTKTVLSPQGQLEEMTFEEIQKEASEEEGEKVFEPKTHGMEIAIEVLDFYLDQDTSPAGLCRFICEKVRHHFRGDAIFYASKQGAELSCLYNGFIEARLPSQPLALTEKDFEGLSRKEKKELEDTYKRELSDYEKQREALQKSWDLGSFRRFGTWKEMKTPTWLDHTFQNSENEFVFPFYEGATLLGLAIFSPHSDFNPEKAESLEVIFEVARGLYLTEYHQEVQAIPTSDHKKETKKAEESGFFSKLFKRAV